MKKLITVVLILSIIFSLIGCHKMSGKNKNGSGYSESGDNTAKYNNSSGQDINAGVLEFAEDKRPELYISDIIVEVVDDALTIGGAACLKDEVAEAQGEQAIRVFFNYKTNANGTKIIIDGKEFKIVSRGVIYKSGDGYTLNNTFDLINERKSSEFNVDNNALISRKEDNFTNCWKYNVETGMLTFSNYIVGFNLNTRLDTRLIARGFVEYEGEDGATHILYSVAINRSVNGIKYANGNTIENFENKIG